MSSSRAGTLHLLARRPERGRVKSRLARECGDTEALRIWRQLLQNCLQTMSRLDRSLHLHVHWTGRGDADWQRGLPEWACAGEEQTTGDLGNRMSHILKWGWRKYKLPQLLIGADCPWICAEDLQAAFHHLEVVETVLGPALDGGYWCIGSQKCDPSLFPELEWGPNTVAVKTKQSILSAGLSLKSLRVLRDVDHLKDWQAWLSHDATTEQKEQWWKHITKQQI